MKITFILLLLTTYTKFLLSQNFIEVIVQDTVEINADEFAYMIIVSNLDAEDLPHPYNEQENRNIIKIDELDKIISQFKSIEILSSEDELNISPTNSSPIYFKQLIVKKLSELKELVHKLKNYDNLHGSVTGFNSSNENDYEKKLVDKLLVKAKDKAGNYITSNSSIKEIVEISELEVSDLEENVSKTLDWGWTSYPGLSGIPIMANKDGYYYTLAKKIRVKFSINN